MQQFAQTEQEDLSFCYFPNDYRWSHGMLLALGSAPWGGGEIGEVNRIGLRLRGREGDDAAWFREWAAEAEKVESAGRDLIAKGRRRSGAQYLLRAASYYHTGERFAQPKTPDTDAAYARGVQAFRDAAATGQLGPRVECVEIPYEGKSLPALYVRADRRGSAGPAPAMVYFDGLDVTKEIQYLKGVADLAARGVACLIVDGPGNGEAIRFRGFPLIPETERYATPAYEWLAARPEIDPKRVGVMAISLGGYYAPRAAAMERRFACAVAWGAQWDYHETWRRRFERIDRAATPSLSVPWRHLLWVLGVETRDEAMKRLEAFRLDGVVQRMECPFLILHGEGDEQIPLDFARKLHDASGSRRKELRVFTREEGGYHHCQIDNVTVGVAAMWDWLEEVLEPHR